MYINKYIHIYSIEGEKKRELGSKPPEYSIMTRHGVLYRLQYIHIEGEKKRELGSKPPESPIRNFLLSIVFR